MPAVSDDEPLPSAQILEEIIMALVDAPSEVRVTEERSDNEVVFNIKCAKDDQGKVLGKKHRCVTILGEILGRIENKKEKRRVTIVVGGRKVNTL